ncbi:MFS transporter [Paenibacillus kribbensis]|uniref:Major facilitator superfamily (MFS) profile domain-containing protein n=2 Tax=Paenibacillus kribbensis TaxID=172713 RepID=A0A222WU66_9BACL|nr:MFS transporter [Paenibacillus kribbensis]ASR49515.1 hypothetical protein B4V02_23920 [Paenibacillus kribbensis]
MVVLTRHQKLLTLNLFLLTFVLGTSEFVIVGLLTEVAAELQLDISTVGALVSAFALSFAEQLPAAFLLSRLCTNWYLMWLINTEGYYV